MIRLGSEKLLLHAFSTFNFGGPQSRFARFANHAGDRYRHVILAMDNGFGAADLLESHVSFALQPLDHSGRGVAARLSLLCGIIRRSNADLLVTYNWGAIEWALAGWIAAIPHVHFEDGFGVDESNQQLRRRVLFRRLALSRCGKVVVPSRILHRIASEIWRIPKDRLAYVPNGVDCVRFSCRPDDALLAALGVDRSADLVGTVAGLRPEKNLQRLLRAFALTRAHRSAELLIIGSGPERGMLEQQAHHLGIAAHTYFAGQQNAPERLLGALSVYALSSETEQMPISLIEAMAAARPVAAVDVGDVKSMVAAENVPFVVARDDLSLANAITGLLRAPELRLRIGAANRAKAQTEFGQERMFAAYDRLFQG